MAAQPPDVWLRSAWFPFIVSFYWRAVGIFWSIPHVSLTSWWRSPESNRLEGGDPESQHLFGLAWDLDVPGAGARDRAASLARAQGLIAVPFGARGLHLQLFPAGALRRAGVDFPD